MPVCRTDSEDRFFSFLNMYDIIGDIHGHATLLKKLLKTMGYSKRGNIYVHPERTAVFVGDFLNRGPEIRETLRLIRGMAENGNALAILGNHEINNILYHLKDAQEKPLLRQTGKRFASVDLTIREFKPFPDEWKSHRRWMRTLPLFLELENFRVVHASWCDQNIELLKAELPVGKIPKQIFRNLVLDPHSPLSHGILETTRGVHMIMPPDLKVLDSRGRLHRFFRIKWWESPAGKTFHDLSFESKFRLPQYTIPPEILPDFEIYPEDAPPVFFGHYCRGNGPFVINGNLCCVDSCVTNWKVLAAYRWNGETTLQADHFIKVS